MYSRTMAIVILSSFALTPAVSAQPLQWNGSLTRAQVIARARQSFDAQLAELGAQAAAAQARSMRAQTLPNVSVSEGYSNGSAYRLGMLMPAQRFTALEGSVPIFAPQGWAAARAAGFDARAASATAAMGVNQAVTGAVQEYDAAALAEAIVRQRAIDVRDQQSHLELTQQRVRAGAAPRYLIARDQAALARAQQSEEDAKADAVRAVHALEVTLDMDTASNVAVTLETPSPTIAPDTATLERRAYARRPDVVAAHRGLLAAQQRVMQARSAYVPTISATAQTYSGVSSPALGTTGSQIGVSASLPIFDGGSRSAGVRAAQEDYERARIQLDRTRLQAQADVLDAVRDLQAAQRNVVTADSELRNANVELRIAQLRERAGKGIELEALDALAALAVAREDVLGATARYDDSLAALHRAVGDYAPTSY